MHATLAELARLLAGDVVGDGQIIIHGLAPLEQAQPGELSFVVDDRNATRLTVSQASAVLVDMQRAVDRPAIRVVDPYLGFITMLEHFFPPHRPSWGIDARAVLEPDVRVGTQVQIGPYAVVARGVQLGDRVVIYPGTYVGAYCEIGDDCVLYANACLYPRVSLGERVTVHSGAVIGADGFGFYLQPNGAYRKIPQIGRVVIADDVEVGANTCIDRATLGDTIIEVGAKLDNLVQVGHNTVVGAHAVLAGQVGLSGSVRVGAHVRMGGQVGVADHVTVGEGASVMAQSGVPSDIEPGMTVFGTPAMRSTAFKRMHLYSQRLGELFQQVKHLERRLATLEEREKSL